MHLTGICFFLLLTCFNIFWMKVFLSCKHLVISYLSLKVAINFSCLRTFPEPIFPPFLVVLVSCLRVTSIFPLLWSFYLCHKLNTEKLSPGITILDQSTANLAAKTRIFASNFNFFETPDAILTFLLCTVADVAEQKPKQRDRSLKFAGFHNQSPLLTML